MIDLTPIEKYIETPDAFMIDYIPHEIKRLGLDKFLHISIAALDASKVWDDGLRPIQTTSYIYVRAITEIVHTINNYVENEADKDIWFKNLITQHEANIQYEKEHPPVDYEVKTIKRIVKTKSANKNPRRRDENKPTAAERKLAAKIGKINSLTFKIKP